MSGRVRDGVLAGLLVLGVSLAFHWLLYPRIADPDSFYHVAHAQVYASTSLLDSSFPWTAFSAIADQNADLWWGFHVLLVPFAPFRDPAAGIRVAAAVLTLAGLGLVAWLSFRHRLLSAALWPLVFFLAVPNVLYRYVAVRPEVLSVPLALLLLSALVRRQPVLTLALSAALTWIHLSMFWLGPGIGVVWALAVAADRALARSDEADAPGPSAPGGWRTIPGLAVLVAGGTLLGWLLRPNPVGAARLAWIQIAKLLFEKTGGTPLTFAVDLAPLDVPTLWRMSWPLLVPWCVGLGWLAWTAARARHRLRGTPRRERAHLWATVVLAVGFLGLTVFVARRSLVHWAAFATVSLALVVTHLTPPRRREGISRVLLFALPLLFAFSLWRNALNDRYVAEPPDTLQEAATWLAANSRPGDLVFNTHWDTFGPLFARDRVNHYVGGMDPIFQYARSPALYWEFHHLSTDERAEATCPDPVCSDEGLRDTWDVLTRDFGARYVLVQPRRNPRLSLYLLRDVRYRLVLETPREAVFEVLGRNAIPGDSGPGDGGPGDAGTPEGGS